MPGKAADYLRTAELDPAERAALDQEATVRRGQVPRFSWSRSLCGDAAYDGP
ncbi:hypothetical protein [Streptomyces anulatus]|uniref:hypothetical protein n=1 Tax=Streptomyces anulatus TaxID=1892 RepID=UPI00386ED825|nr:hypothetical protein OG536_38765 [Streptomyces anulatus]